MLNDGVLFGFEFVVVDVASCEFMNGGIDHRLNYNQTLRIESHSRCSYFPLSIYLAFFPLYRCKSGVVFVVDCPASYSKIETHISREDRIIHAAPRCRE